MSDRIERPQDSIFWIDVDKIKPNPFQPRTEFNEDRLRDLADSIRQYGVLQPLVVTRKEVLREDGSLVAEYELIAGERRWRASKIAGLSQVPALIRTGDDTDKLKLEMAIIENLQREDLNPIDRAVAFNKLANEFNLKHVDIAKRIGKSREYVSNTIRILGLPQEILDAIVVRKITEGHSKPLLMLIDHPDEQATLFKEIISNHMTVRDAEVFARRVAVDRVRREKHIIQPAILDIEQRLSEKYGTKVLVEQREDKGGRVTIQFFSEDDLQKILDLLEGQKANLSKLLSDSEAILPAEQLPEAEQPAEPIQPDEDLYFVKNFSL
ncbi:MAG: ParB/RepB/Spo0J family partition protein [Candidatus Vogelbacteria bacterium]|nr:ParB/RepB/Spo0J family partition protein [Candidatus Vogelbacteria bacterium]